MSQLDPRADYQLAQDAAAKIRYPHKKPRLVLRWLWARSWKAKLFFALALTLVVGSLILAGLERVGIVTPPPVKQNCEDKKLSPREYAGCVLRQEEAENKAKQEANDRRWRAFKEEKDRERALDDMRNDRALENARAEFSQRVTALARGSADFSGGGSGKYEEQTITALAQLLVLTPDHPFRAAHQSSVPATHGLFHYNVIDKMPRGGEAATAESKQLCDDSKHGWKQRCVEHMLDNVAKILPRQLRRNVQSLMSHAHMDGPYTFPPHPGIKLSR